MISINCLFSARIEDLISARIGARMEEGFSQTYEDIVIYYWTKVYISIFIWSFFATTRQRQTNMAFAALSRDKTWDVFNVKYDM